MKGRTGKTMHFGKHRGRDLGEIPEDYLEWLIRSSQETIDMAQAELERRRVAAEAEMGWVGKIIAAGYRDLMKRHHPDVGGTTEDAQKLNAAYEALKSAGLD